MISVKLDEAKELMFDLSVEGIDKKLLSGKFIVKMNGVEYGFPCKINDDKIKVNIPPLNSILKEGVSGTYDVSLEMVGNNTYQVPWNGTIDLVSQPKIMAVPEQIKEDIHKDVKLKANLTSQKEIIKEDKKKATNSALRSKLS